MVCGWIPIITGFKSTPSSLILGFRIAHKACSETELFDHWLDGFADQIGLDQLLYVFVWWMKRIDHMRRTDLAAWYFDVRGILHAKPSALVVEFNPRKHMLILNRISCLMNFSWQLYCMYVSTTMFYPRSQSFIVFQAFSKPQPNPVCFTRIWHLSQLK